MIILSTTDLSLRFGTTTVLENISFSINEGDRLGIIGVNGAGKTSLFRLITGEYTPDSGAVYVSKGKTVGLLAQNADMSDGRRRERSRAYVPCLPRAACR